MSGDTDQSQWKLLVWGGQSGGALYAKGFTAIMEVQYKSGVTKHKACTLCAQTQTHTKKDAGRDELERGVN